MKLLLVVAVLGFMAACALAEEEHAEEHTCGPLEKIKVRRQWTKAYGEGKHRLEFGLHIWNHFFKDFPKARDMFKKYRGDNVYSPQFQAMSQRLLAAFGMIIDTTDDPEALKVIVEHVKVEHAEKGVKPEFYDAFRDELLETLPEYLGTHLDWDAWTSCLNQLIAALK
jgi:hemoglobin-like flavoprotein